MKQLTNKVVCRAYLRSQRLNYSSWPYEILALDTGYPEAQCIAACKRAAAYGLIDYDTDVIHGWLTVLGKQLIGLDKIHDTE